MSFYQLSKFQKKEFARLKARGPTPAEVALAKVTAERDRKRAEVEAAWKAIEADDRRAS